MAKGIKLATKSLEPEVEKAAQAIMTTDTFPKKSFFKLKLAGKEVSFVGIAKGAGMINPEMATTLFFVLTDAAVERNFLQTSFKEAVEKSFNSITVDGETSTNDTGYLLANGAAENRVITGKSSEAKKFKRALFRVLDELALQVVKDGEGATKLIEIIVEGSRDDKEARLLAKRVANSLLVKTAFFGEDLNWGRILAALGAAGVSFDPWKVEVLIQGFRVYKNGEGLKVRKKAEEALKEKKIEVMIKMGKGKGKARVLTADLSYDYVKINSSYRS
jgi:glutamate N-acetyltransferase/amino-acid N-acetyltransferase